MEASGTNTSDEEGARATGRLVESTQAEDRRMIALVRDRTLLYTRSSMPVASYYTKVKRLWQEVADIMGWTVEEVRRKWSHIRNSYSRHLRNEMRGVRTGRGRAVSRWYLADELEFLRHHMATDSRRSSHAGPVPTSLLELNADSKPWYCVPSPQPAPAAGSLVAQATYRDEYCDRPSGQDEDKPYFLFFHGLYGDYQELPPAKQRLFRRKCLLLLHELVDEEGENFPRRPPSTDEEPAPHPAPPRTASVSVKLEQPDSDGT